MRSYEEIRQSFRRRAIAKLVAIGAGLMMLVVAAGFGLYTGARALWLRLTAPRQAIVIHVPAPPAPPPAPTIYVDHRGRCHDAYGRYMSCPPGIGHRGHRFYLRASIGTSGLAGDLVLSD